MRDKSKFYDKLRVIGTFIKRTNRLFTGLNIFKAKLADAPTAYVVTPD
jgi:hypothetical protein